MAARAMWKGIVRFGAVAVPVKLYAAIEDRSIHFRMLHAKDHAPIKQVLVNPRTDAVVPYSQALRAYATDEGELVILTEEDLAGLEPEPSRDITISAFLPPEAIDHRWYRRPYYLGPGDRAAKPYFALIAALERSGREGIAHWTMRKKDYVGALRLQDGYPILIALHHADEVVALEELDAPGGPKLAERELEMAKKLLDMYEASFEPSDYRDEYRARVRELIDKKARGEEIETAPARPARPTADLAAALEQSLAQERKRA
jgi:DNA end-binding protein Ku